MEPHERTRTLRALSGYFRDNPLPDHLADNSRANRIIIQCIDSRERARGILHQGRGNAFGLNAAAAALPEWKENDAALDKLSFDLGVPLGAAPVEHIIIMGHTSCSAAHALVKDLLGDHASHPWLTRITPEGLRDTLHAAKANGASIEDLCHLTEQILVLQSVRNMYDYVLGERTIADRVNAGELTITGVIDQIHSCGKGSDLLVYDDAQATFRPLADIHREAGSPTVEQMEAALPKPATMLPARQGVNSLSFAPGAKSETIASVEMHKLDHGIRVLMERMEHLHEEPAR